jgi:hypothetical protein
MTRTPVRLVCEAVISPSGSLPPQQAHSNGTLNFRADTSTMTPLTTCDARTSRAGKIACCA